MTQQREHITRQEAEADQYGLVHSDCKEIGICPVCFPGNLDDFLYIIDQKIEKEDRGED